MKYWQLFSLMAFTAVAPHLPTPFALGLSTWWTVLTVVYAVKDK